MSEWLLIYFDPQERRSPQSVPIHFKRPLHQLLLLLRMLQHKVHRRLLHRRHHSRRKTDRQSLERPPGLQLFDRRVDHPTHSGRPSPRLRSHHIRHIQLHRSLALLRVLYRPFEITRPHMPRPLAQTRLWREAGVDPLVGLALELQIELVQQIFLVGKVSKQRALGHTRTFGDLRCRRAQSGLGDLVHRRLQDCASLLRTSGSCHAAIRVQWISRQLRGIRPRAYPTIVLKCLTRRIMETDTMKPRIAIPNPTSSNLEYNSRSWPQYAEAVIRAGGEPVEIPLNATPREIANLINLCHGVLLPGSPADVNPQKFGHDPIPESSPADPGRENVDELLL